MSKDKHIWKSQTSLSKRIDVLSIPIDILKPENLKECVKEILKKKTHNQIVLLDFNTFLKARHNSELYDCLAKAALVLPLSERIVSAAGFLGKEKPIPVNPFSFIIRLLGILEEINGSVYIIGSRAPLIQVSERNLRTSFPKLKIVGRYNGFFSQEEEADILLAIKKASPSLILASRGLKANLKWLFRNRQNFGPGISLWDKNCFDIFSGKRKKDAEHSAGKTIKKFFSYLIRPWKIYRLFVNLYFLIVLLVYKIRGL